MQFLIHHKYTINFYWIIKEIIWYILRKKKKEENPNHSEEIKS